MSVIDCLEPIKEYLTKILPGERIKYNLPLKLIWDDETDDYKWNNVAVIPLLTEGCLPEDIFVTMRFNKPDLTVDIYRLP